MTTLEKAIAFDPHAEPMRYRYEVLADHLTELIYTGELKPNTPLPAERHLAAQVGLSLGTVRHATRLLRERGLVVTLQSKGTFVVLPERTVG